MTRINIDHLYEFYGVLYNRYRLRIILMCEREAHTVAELSRKLQLSYSITVKYVGMLARHGLVKKTRQASGRVHVRSLVKLTPSGLLKQL